MKRKIIFLFLMIVMMIPLPVDGSAFSNSSSKDNLVTLYFFHGDGCPHCEDEMVWLNGITTKYPNLVVKEYEVWYSEENDSFMQKVKEKFGVTRPGVPFTVIGDKYFLGFSDSTGNSMETQIRFCSKHTHSDMVKAVQEGLDEVPIGEELELEEETKKKEEIEDKKRRDTNIKNKVWIPLFIVLGVMILCGGTIYSIYAVKKKGK